MDFSGTFMVLFRCFGYFSGTFRVLFSFALCMQFYFVRRAIIGILRGSKTRFWTPLGIDARGIIKGLYKFKMGSLNC